MRRIAALAALLLAAPAHALTLGEAPPDALGSELSGHEVRVSEHRGKVVVVSFWASWCGYCRKELPALAGLQEVGGKDRLQVVAVNTMDDRDVYFALRRKLKGIDLTMTRDAHEEIREAYGVEGIPHLFIIDRDGKLAFELTGYGEESLQRIVDEINRQLARPVAAGGT